MDGQHEKTGSQFYINLNNSGPIGTICLLVMIAVPVLSMGAILTVFLMTCFNRVGFQELSRRITNQVMGIRRRNHNGTGDQDCSDESTQIRSSAQGCDHEENEPTMNSPVNRCFCCKVRHVISILFLGKFGGPGECFAKALAPLINRGEEETDAVSNDEASNETVVILPAQSYFKRRRV